MSASAIYDDHSALDRDDLTNAVAQHAVNLMSFESAGFIRDRDSSRTNEMGRSTASRDWEWGG